MNQAISVVIPSLLKKVPGSDAYWCERALKSVSEQIRQPAEILVALDPYVTLPEKLTAAYPRLKVANSKHPTHSAATNAGVAAATSPIVAILEDDDLWGKQHLEVMLTALFRYDAQFVSASQLECALAGHELGPLDFPTPSSWLLPKAVWDELGGLDERFLIHGDNEFLGKLNSAKKRRVHLIEDTPSSGWRPWQQHIKSASAVVPVVGQESLWVKRTVHDGSVTGQSRNPAHYLAQRGPKEYIALEVLYGAVPW